MILEQLVERRVVLVRNRRRGGGIWSHQADGCFNVGKNSGRRIWETGGNNLSLNRLKTFSTSEEENFTVPGPLLV